MYSRCRTFHVILSGFLLTFCLTMESNALYCYNCVSPVLKPNTCVDPVANGQKVSQCKGLANVCAKTFMAVVARSGANKEVEGEIMGRYCAKVPVNHETCIRIVNGTLHEIVDGFPIEGLRDAFPATVNITGMPIENLLFRRLTSCRCMEDKCNREKGHTIPQQGSGSVPGQGEGGQASASFASLVCRLQFVYILVMFATAISH